MREFFRRLFAGSVPRDLYEDLRAELREQRRTNRKLTATLIKMKVAGGSIPRVVAGPLSKREPTDVQARILEALDANPRTKKAGPLRTRHLTWAEDEIAKNPDNERHIEKVLGRLRAWGTVPTDEGEDDGDVLAVTVRN